MTTCTLMHFSLTRSVVFVLCVNSGAAYRKAVMTSSSSSVAPLPGLAGVSLIRRVRRNYRFVLDYTALILMSRPCDVMNALIDSTLANPCACSPSAKRMSNVVSFLGTNFQCLAGILGAYANDFWEDQRKAAKN